MDEEKDEKIEEMEKGKKKKKDDKLPVLTPLPPQQNMPGPKTMMNLVMMAEAESSTIKLL